MFKRRKFYWTLVTILALGALIGYENQTWKIRCYLFPACIGRPMPNPIVSFPFDPSAKGASVEGTFSVTQHRSYIVGFAVAFDTENQREDTLALLGGGYHNPPGIPLRLRVAISPMSKDGAMRAPVLDVVADSISSYSMAAYDGHKGVITRNILTVDLYPGAYWIAVTSVENNPSFYDKMSRLTVQYISQVAFVYTPYKMAKPESEQ